MRYRKLALAPGQTVYSAAAAGDFSFGQGAKDFWINTPDAVAQAVMTRLAMTKGAWFLNLNAGVDYNTQVLGYYTKNTRDLVIQATILGTPGVKEIISYSSDRDPNTRAWTALVRISTIYGAAQIVTPL